MVDLAIATVSAKSGIFNSEWLQVIIVISYYAIPTMLVYSLYKGRDIPFQWMFLVFGAFFVACGTIHVIQTWYLWFPESLISQFMKAITAFVAGSSVLLLLTLMPFALALPSPARLEAANLALENEIAERRKAETALAELAEVLEQRVQARTGKLSRANNYLIKEVQERKKAKKALQQSEAELRIKARELERALQKLQESQAQLVHTEKLSALGELTAGIAHEINNPINFIDANIAYARNYVEDLLRLVNIYGQHYPNPVEEIQEEIQTVELDFLREDLPKLITSMKVGTDRICAIVSSMRNFSRLDKDGMSVASIHEGIDSTLLILQHRMKANGKLPGIELIKDYGDLPLVECYAGQLNQVFMNIISNAIDVLRDSSNAGVLNGRRSCPTIEISTKVAEGDRAIVRISDNGAGMTEEVKAKIFNHFFTTKPAGKGTGLGLSISCEIVREKHCGSLECLSRVGEGTEFVISLPIRQQKSETSRLLAMQEAV
ncbi:ATPase [Tychonema sp. LEGE 07199]|uniref:sensor histidine kinase n=1 Tax=unclassified Tychonema TaxID=2642144 RepID=UPI0018830390|nr:MULTISPECIES: ATP-binding protein [unclassified Tychonema]MBE9122354.1 ATPase [Tychonema sp. LEGE 07199]MBE9134440.1 ATPase [Tychonema sp. LEGE 07196]